MGGSSKPHAATSNTTTSAVQPEFQPFYNRLYGSAMNAAEKAAGGPQTNPYMNQQFGQGIQFPLMQGPQMQPAPVQSMQNPQTLQQAAQAQAGQPAGLTSYGPGGPLDFPNPYAWQGTPGNPHGMIVGEPYTGQFTAPSTAIEGESLAQREAIARQLQGFGTPLMQMGQAQAQGNFLRPESNPFFAGNLQASLQPAIDAFSRNVMPQFNSQALQSGAFKGSSARDMAAGNLANDFGRNLLQTAAQMGNQNYAMERQIQQQTPALLQQAAGLQQLSPEIMAQVGAGQREIMQRPIDEALLRFQEYQQAPFRPLGPLASIIYGGNVGTQTTSFGSSLRPTPLASGIAGGLGGAALGAGVGNQLFPNNGMYAGGLAGLGGLLGGLAGGL